MARFWALDNNFVKTAELNAINIQWRPRYYEVGDFEILMPKSAYSPDMQYVWKVGSPHVGIIQAPEYEHKAQGKFITLSGYFFETHLSRAVILTKGRPVATLPANMITVIRSMVQSRFINDLSMGSLVSMGTFASTTETVAGCDENEFEVGQIGYKLLKSIKYSQRLRFDYDQKRFFYDIWQGVDRSTPGYDQVLFSDNALSANVNNLKYKQDISDYKNYAHVFIDRGEDRIITTDYSLAKLGEPLNKMVVEFSDTESETDAQAREAGKQQALLDLLNHKKITSIEFDPEEGAFEYEKDYNVGDKVNLTLHEIGISYAERIVGADEVYKNGTESVKLHFGDEKKIDYRKERW